MRRFLTWIIAVTSVVVVVPPAVAGATRPGTHTDAASVRGADTRSRALVRPGAKVLFEDLYCTMNFVFRGSDGHDYVATAGHCPLAGETTTKVWRKGSGIAAHDANGLPIGEFSFAAFHPKEDYDFAVIRLKPNVVPDPQMAFFGGPTSMNDEMTRGPEILNFYGHAQVFGDVSPNRQLVTPGGFDDDESIFASGIAFFGDSGAPVTTDAGEALGVLSQGSVSVRIPNNGGPPYPANTIVVRLPRNVELAENALEIGLELRTAPPLRP